MPEHDGSPVRGSIVSIAAGASQVPLLRAARRLGFGVVAVDRDEHAPGFALADAHVRCSTHDADAVLDALRPLAARHELRAVVTKSSGVPVATTAAVAHALGLPGLDPAAAARAVTKPGQMELASRAGVPVPAHAAVREVADVAALGLGFPLVVKPSLTIVGKAGISVVRDQARLTTRFAEAKNAAADGIVEVEEFVPGSDATVAAFFDEDGFQLLGLVDEETGFEADDRARGRGFAMPSRWAGTEVGAELVGHAARLVEVGALGTGTGFFTFRVEDPRVTLLEMHLDLAGDFVADRLLPAATGIEFLEAALLHLSGLAVPPPRPEVTPAAVRFLFAGDLALEREDKLARLGELLTADAVDTSLQPTGEGDDRRVGCALLRADTPEALQELSWAMDRILGRQKIL